MALFHPPMRRKGQKYLRESRKYASTVMIELRDRREPHLSHAEGVDLCLAVQVGRAHGGDDAKDAIGGHSKGSRECKRGGFRTGLHKVLTSKRVAHVLHFW